MTGAVNGAALLPCPFCGNLHPTCADREYEAFIYCNVCGTAGPVAFVGEHAEDFWNKRDAAAQVPVTDERAAFEAAYPSIHPVQHGPDIFERNGDGYAYLRVQGAWEGWQARAAVGVQAPDGWKLVPVEATLGMLYEAQENAHILPPRGKRIWEMMLAVAPNAPSALSQQGEAK